MLNKNQRLYSPMKPKSKTPRLFLAAAIAPLVLSATITAQTIRTWDAGGNTTVLTDALNWSGDAVPASTGATAVTRQDASWNGVVAGPLNLTYAGAFGGGFGVGLVMTSNQTSSLTLTNTNAAAQTIRLINSTGGTVGGIQIASGAGALTIGAAGAANPVTLVLGSGALGVDYNYYFANSSNNTATIEENVTITKGGNHNASPIFSAGNWNVKGVVGALSASAGGGALTVNGGSVTLSANNTGDGAVNVNGGTLSISAANNLGTGTGAVRLGQTTTSGVLEFTGSSNATISRLMRVGNGASASNQTGSATITNIGTGVLTFDNAPFNEVGNTFASGAARSLTLSGNNTGDNTISGVIANNNPGTVKVDKAETGKWVLSGNNTFTGGVDIDGGILAVGHDNALGTGGLRFDSTTATIQSSDATDRTIGNSINFAQSMNFGATGTGNLTFTGLVAGGVGGKSITVNGITTEFSNTISGNGDRIKAGTGTLVLSGDNSGSIFDLFVNTGTLTFTSANALGNGTTAIRIGQTSTNAVLKFTGASDAAIDRQISIGNGNSTGNTGSSTIQNDSATGALTFGNATFNFAGNAVEARSLTLRGTNAGNNLISGAIVDNIGANATVNLVKNDSGTWNITGENTFSGGIQIWNGVLEFDGNGSLGAQTIQTRIGRTSTSGTLRHTGAGNTTVTGQMQVGFGAGGTGNATIESTGVGTLSFSNAAFNNPEGAAAVNRTLTLGGNNTGLNTISGAIGNNNNSNARIAITKTGTGTWVLGGNNTYTGNTTVSDGTLVLANTGRLRFNIGATGVNNTLNGTGNVTLNGGVIFNLTSAGTTTGNSWNIVNVATLIEGYGGTFSVSSLVGPFTNSSGTWTRTENSVTYRFVQSTGVLSVIPAGANYSTWASAFSGPALSNTASTADPDNDGLINAIEYALGLDPRFSSPSPGVISNGGKTITFTKGAEAKVNGDVTYGIEVSTTLGVAPSPWTLGIFTDGPDTIAITFPAGPVKNFARLKVILAP